MCLYTTTDNVHVPPHAAERWVTRFDVAQSAADAWRTATPVDAQRAPRNSAMYARVHAETGALMLVQRDALLTVGFVGREPPAERRSLIEQVPGLSEATVDAHPPMEECTETTGVYTPAEDVCTPESGRETDTPGDTDADASGVVV